VIRLVAAAVLFGLVSCRPAGDQAIARRAAARDDPAYAGVQARGEVAMGVDQYTSSHVFEPLRDGGRIALERDTDDTAGITRIRGHMEQIARRFADGDFQLPGFVHARAVPGTGVMSARRDLITYTVESLPRGGAVRVRSGDPEAVRAIHAFLAFQREDHHAAAHHGQ
jgi:hypothetical protein